MNTSPRISTGLLVTLGAIFLGSSTGGFLTLALLPCKHIFWVIVALLLGALGYWFITRAYFILEDRIQRARKAYDDSYTEGHYDVRDILQEDS